MANGKLCYSRDKCVVYHDFCVRTFPALNILLYNAIGGTNGDELYGVEPASYYVKNLFLNVGLAWILLILSPVVLFIAWLMGMATSRAYHTPATSKNTDENQKMKKHTIVLDEYVLVQWMSVFLWLGILFSRPHKVSNNTSITFVISNSLDGYIGRTIYVSHLSIDLLCG
jgi:hypothetical protein